MLVKCAACGKKIEREIAFRIESTSKNQYYCSQEEYEAKNQESKDKDRAYRKIYDLFGYPITNTAFYKKMNSLAQMYSFQKIADYVSENFNTLHSSLTKDFSTEYAKIRYFAAILKNNLAQYQPVKEVILENDVELVPYPTYVRKKGRIPMSDYI